MQLNVTNIGPRRLEDQTSNAVIRDYGAAWKSMAQALEGNRPEALGDLWTGFAREQLLQAIAQQKHSAIRVRYLDDQHQLDAIFYSPEGSALQLKDTAQIERQVLDGNSVVTSETLTLHYLVVMTPAADHWQVRILQSE